MSGEIEKEGGESLAVPIDRERRIAYRNMLPETQKLADDFRECLSRAATGAVLVYHRIGSQLIDVVRSEATYGTAAVSQLATYLGINEGQLYSYHRFATTFDREYVAENASIANAKGVYLSIGHWVILARVADQRDREKLLRKALQKSWSVHELDGEVRAGATLKSKGQKGAGRKPATPTSPMAGLTTFARLGFKFKNLADEIGDSLCESLNTAPPDVIDRRFRDQLAATRNQVNEMITAGEAVAERFTEALDRAEEVLAHKPPEEETAEETAAAPAKKKGAKEKGAKKKKGAPEKGPEKGAKKKGAKKTGVKKTADRADDRSDADDAGEPAEAPAKKSKKTSKKPVPATI